MNKEELEERTLNFTINLIKTLKTIPRDLINDKIIRQLTASGTSIGANYREANGAESKKDFQHKIGIVFKEARETNYWLSVLKKSYPEFQFTLNQLWIESDELKRIFGATFKTCKENSNQKSPITHQK